MVPGITAKTNSRVRVELTSCTISSGCLDVTWVDEVEGLREVFLDGVDICMDLGRRELLPLLEGRESVCLVPCPRCGYPVHSDGPGECSGDDVVACVLRS